MPIDLRTPPATADDRRRFYDAIAIHSLTPPWEVRHHLGIHADMDAWSGANLDDANPATGGPPMPAMATFMRRLPAGFFGRP